MSYDRTRRVITPQSGPLNRCSVRSWLAMSALLSALYAPLGTAETYRWVDENGVVNYAERKPTGVPEAAVTALPDPRPVTVPASSPNADRSNRAILPSAEPRDNESLQGLDPEQAALLDELQAAEGLRRERVAKIQANNCARAQSILTNLTSKSRIRVRDDNGTERVLDEEERQERIADAQRGIAENCTAS